MTRLIDHPPYRDDKLPPRFQIWLEQLRQKLVGLNMDDYYHRIASGQLPKHRLVHKFGRYDSVGTSFVPVSRGGVYQTPQVAGATTLRIKAGGNVNDDASGSGAREVTLVGLDTSGNEQLVTLATNGASASAPTAETFLRFYRGWVSASGTYASSAAGSHAADIVIENGAGGTDWGTIVVAGFPRAQTEIGAVTIAVGETAYFLTGFGFSDTSKITELLFFQRENILETAPPYTAMRVLFEERVEGGEFTVDPKGEVGPFVGPCDLGFMAKIDAGTATVDIDFELHIVKD